jgi:hypothetical protein
MSKRTVLKIEFPGTGVPQPVLYGVERVLHEHYDGTRLSKVWTLPGEEPPALWNFHIYQEETEDDDEVGEGPSG